MDAAVDAWEDNDWWRPAIAADAAKPWPYRGFQELRRVWALELAGRDGHPRFWRWYAAWVLARISGRIPLGAVSDKDSPEALERCPSCGVARAALEHFVCRCPATALLWEDFTGATGYSGPREDWDQVARAIFGRCTDAGARAGHIRLIGVMADRLSGRRPDEGAPGD